VSYDWSRGAAEHNPVRIIVMVGTIVMIGVGSGAVW